MLEWLYTYGAMAVEIVVLTVVVYYVLELLRGSRGAGVFRGSLIVFAVCVVGGLFFTQYVRLYRLHFLLNKFLTIFAIMLIVVFQPELRRGLIRLGQQPLFALQRRRETAMIREVIKAIMTMATNKVGALITFERELGLKSYAEGGTPLDAEVTAALLYTIFWPGSPLHDGAVIIRRGRAVAAGCLFPLTEKPGLAPTMGTRHRAAIGVTEESDAVSLVVSEETGQVSLAVRGQITQDLEVQRVKELLTDLLTTS